MKLQVAAFLSFLIMPYALAEDQGGLKKKKRRGTAAASCY